MQTVLISLFCRTHCALAALSRSLVFIPHFSAKGFTQAQAKIKCALNDERFSTACVGMVTVGVLKENVNAVIDNIKLTQQDLMVT